MLARNAEAGIAHRTRTAASHHLIQVQGTIQRFAGCGDRLPGDPCRIWTGVSHRILIRTKRTSYPPFAGEGRLIDRVSSVFGGFLALIGLGQGCRQITADLRHAQATEVPGRWLGFFGFRFVGSVFVLVDLGLVTLALVVDLVELSVERVSTQPAVSERQCTGRLCQRARALMGAYRAPIVAIARGLGEDDFRQDQDAHLSLALTLVGLDGAARFAAFAVDQPTAPGDGVLAFAIRMISQADRDQILVAPAQHHHGRQVGEGAGAGGGNGTRNHQGLVITAVVIREWALDETRAARLATQVQRILGKRHRRLRARGFFPHPIDGRLIRSTGAPHQTCRSSRFSGDDEFRNWPQHGQHHER